MTQILVDDSENVVAAIVPAPEELLSAGLNSAFVQEMRQAQAELDFAASNIVGIHEPAGIDFQTISSGISLGASLSVSRLFFNLPTARD